MKVTTLTVAMVCACLVGVSGKLTTELFSKACSCIPGEPSTAALRTTTSVPWRIDVNMWIYRSRHEHLRLRRVLQPVMQVHIYPTLLYFTEYLAIEIDVPL